MSSSRSTPLLLANSVFQCRPISPNADRTASNFSPSIWGDRFLQLYAFLDDTSNETEQRNQLELKEKVTTMLLDSMPSQRLDLIDQFQRLGVSYLFETQIHQLLQQIHNDCSSHDDDLHTVALRFRLLRQQGFKVSCNVFNIFIDADGKFKESLVSDVAGLLSLYEAAHLRTHEEDVLDEALSFATTHLEAAAVEDVLSGALMRKVIHALYQPLWIGYQRLEPRRYLSAFHELDTPQYLNKTLVTFAKYEFNRLQRVHQKELSDLTRWWKELDAVNKLPFARDRVTECYFWALGVNYEPQYQLGRKLLCKVLGMLSLIDDTYDVYGTPEQLELFTEAVQRWDISAMDSLPDYMKVIYQALLDVYLEAEEDLAKEGKVHRIHFAREAMKIQVLSYFKEAKWFHDKYTPKSLDEYMSVGLVTSACLMVIVTIFVSTAQDIAPKDSLDWLFPFPKILVATSTISRLLNDIQSHKFEQKRGHVSSAVECYMKEHCVPEEEAVTELTKQVKNAWKDINQEWLNAAASIPRLLLLQIINLERACEVSYKHGDSYTHPENDLKDIIETMLIQPVPI